MTEFCHGCLGHDAVATLALRSADFSDAVTLVQMQPVQAAPEGKARRDVFTVLVPGDITSDSFSTTIVEAFAQFREELGKPARLVLAGRTSQAGPARQLADCIAHYGLADCVLLTGGAGRDAVTFLAAVDLLVFLDDPASPPAVLQAAVQAGIPVLGRPVASVGYAVTPAGLQDAMADSPSAALLLADRLLELARNPACAAALAACQQRGPGMRRWTNGRCGPLWDGVGWYSGPTHASATSSRATPVSRWSGIWAAATAWRQPTGCWHRHWSDDGQAA